MLTTSHGDTMQNTLLLLVVLFLSLFYFFLEKAYAQEASVLMRLNVRLHQCGSMSNMRATCEREPICCVFVQDETTSQLEDEMLLNFDKTNCEWLILDTPSGQDWIPQCELTNQ